VRGDGSTTTLAVLALALAATAGACAGASRPASSAASPATSTASAPAVTAPPLPAPGRSAESRFVDSVLALMTLEEKLGQLNQPGAAGVLPTGPQQRTAGEEEVRAGRIGSFLSINGAAATRRLQRVAVEESRMKIPLLFGNDVIHGHRTIFPVPLAEAASWDTAAVRRAARAAAVEATAYGINWTYAPMLDIARDPRWGRIVEGSGEDPYLGAAMGAARVRGFQGDSLGDPTSLLATAKHYVAYGAAEGGRDYNVADVSERTLHEVYLPPFEAAVRAGVGSVMASFNEVAGVPMHAHAGLIDTLLRGRWGWDGLLVSDYTGVTEMMAHGVAADSAAAAALALRAGVDVDMVSQVYLKVLPRVLQAGRARQADLDESVRRVLRAKYRLGLFRDPYARSDTARERARTLAPEAVAEARDMARRSIVLLKNDTVAGAPLLPLRKELRTLAVIGPLADDSGSALGGWAGIGRPEDAVTVLAGIRRAVPRARVLYARGAGVEDRDTSGFAAAVAAARQADAVVLVLGEHRDMSGEGRSRTTLDLPGVQEELARRVHATGKPVVAVLMNGRPLSVNWLAERVPAIVEAWYLGVQTGPAVADVLFGDYNPAGRLPVTFPRNVGQVPLYYNHKNTGRPPDPKTPYTKKDAYTSKYFDVQWTPLFPFGHGLSYTTFTYGDLRLSSARVRPTDSLTVTVHVTNSGRRAGDEVVQLYIRDEAASVTRPVRELRGFRRITLAAGETGEVTFVLRPRDLAVLDAGLRPVVEPGFFTIYVGPSSVSGREARIEVVE